MLLQFAALCIAPAAAAAAAPWPNSTEGIHRFGLWSAAEKLAFNNTPGLDKTDFMWSVQQTEVKSFRAAMPHALLSKYVWLHAGAQRGGFGGASAAAANLCDRNRRIHLAFSDRNRRIQVPCIQPQQHAAADQHQSVVVAGAPSQACGTFVPAALAAGLILFRPPRCVCVCVCLCSWVLYRCDRKTPATYWGTSIPLDISNPEVLQWQLHADVGDNPNSVDALINAGFDSISLDVFGL